jgi:hypothetical protein
MPSSTVNLSRQLARVLIGGMLFLGPLLLWGPRVFAQSTNNFLDFSDSNDIRTFGGFYHTLFAAGNGSIATGAAVRRGPRLQANSSAYIGFNLNYRWLSIYYAFNIPSTSVLHGKDKEVKASQINITHWWSHWGLDGSYQHDRGLVDQDDQGPRVINSVWRFADYKYFGVNVDYFFNAGRFSYEAADNFSRQQTRSGGTWLLTVTPAYQNFTLQKSAGDSTADTTLFNLLKANAGHVILLAKAGYTHQFVWNEGRWSCSPLLCAGPGLGVYLDNLHTRQKLYPMLGYQARLTFGYNGPKWYTYVSGIYDLMEETQKNLGLKTINESASLSLGYRFHSFHHRILHLL